MTQELMEALQKPFEARDIEWRIGRSGIKNDKPWAMALAYLTNRAIMSRLDEVVGPEGWKNEFKEFKVGESVGVLCGLSLKLDGEWVTKWDGAGSTDFEPFKGGLSDSMKRAAVQFGLGRYLYNLDETFVECSATKGQGNWKYAKTKDDKVFYWKTPTLPDWALPKVKAPSAYVSLEQADALVGMLGKYDFEMERFLTWASKAAKHDVVAVDQLPKSLYQKAFDMLKSVGEAVPV